jgi:hypothetical protein
MSLKGQKPTACQLKVEKPALVIRPHIPWHVFKKSKANSMLAEG